MKNVLVIDFLTKKEAKKALKQYDEIWYFYSQSMNEVANINCIIDYESENPVYWEKEELALQLCNKSYTSRLDKRLNLLHNYFENVELIHKKYQTSSLTDYHCASIIKILIGELLLDESCDMNITYKNNQFLYSHDLPEQVTVIKKLSIQTVLKNLVLLSMHFGYYMYNILAIKNTRDEDIIHKEYDLLFYFDRKGQEIEWKYVLDKISKNKKIAVYYHTRPKMKTLSQDDLEEIFNVIKTTGVDIDDVFVDKQLASLSLKERIYFLYKGFKGYISILYYLLNDFRNIKWYMKYFLIESEALINKKTVDQITTKRFITVGEYDPDLNVRTTMWKSNGAITENIVHGLKQAIFEDSYIYLDRIYVWGNVMENEFRNMDCSIGEYIYCGPMYIHKIFDVGENITLKKTIGVFSNDIELVSAVDSWGVGNLIDHKKTFFKYICYAAEKYDNYNFIIYPHPRERERGYIIENFDSEMTKLPNLKIDFERSRMGSFKHIKSLDLGITMHSSIGFEMLFAGFKCVFFDTKNELIHHYNGEYGDIFTNPGNYSMDEWSDFVIEKARQSKESFFKEYQVPTFNEYSLVNSILNEKNEAVL